MRIFDRNGKKLFVVPPIPKFTKPILLANVFQKPEKESKIIVRRGHDEPSIIKKNNLTFCLIKKESKNKRKFKNYQTTIEYQITKKGDIKASKFRKELPYNHNLLIDIVNKRVKLEGAKACKFWTSVTRLYGHHLK